MQLSELDKDSGFKILGLTAQGEIKKRLVDMGFISGATGKVLREALLRDPIELWLNQSRISLRRSEAAQIIVEPLENLHPKPIRIALAGNPNSGKTSLFNALTGKNQHVGNYPGVTVEKKIGLVHWQDQVFEIVDLPGTYSLTAYSLEEIVARDFVIQDRPDVVVDVIDSTNLERNLYLCLQFQELGAPVVGALNMTDEAEQKGIHIDARQLGLILGIPMVKTVASKGRGKDELLQVITAVAQGRLTPTARHLNYGEELELQHSRIIAELNTDPHFSAKYSPHWTAIKLLEADEDALQKVQAEHAHATQVLSMAAKCRQWIEQHFGKDSLTVVAEQRYAYIHGACRETVRIEQNNGKIDFTEAIDRLMLHRFLGVIMFCLIMFAIYLLTFQLGNPLADILGEGISWLGEQVRQHLAPGIISDFLVGGVIGGVGGVLVFLPVVLILFLGLSFLEDTGYMARAAFVMDKFLHLFGLHGRSFIPLMVSTGCAVPGVMSTRTLVNQKDRILTILVAPLMLCGAKTPVVAILAAAFFPQHAALIFWGIWCFGWLLAFLVALAFRKILFQGADSPFVMELPPYRIPTLRAILTHVFHRAWHYIKKAGTVILAVSIVVWFLLYFPKPEHYSQNYAQQIQQLQQKYQRHLETLSPAQQTALVLLPGTDGVARQVPYRKKLQIELQTQVNRIRHRMALENLEASLGGQIAKWFTPLLKPCGFDWKITIALLSGVPAKEMIISSMSIACGMGENRPESVEAPLKRKLARDPAYNPLLALALMVFVLVYIPCLPTLVVVRKELGSWKWPLLMVVYTLVIAWGLATLIYQGGSLLGWAA